MDLWGKSVARIRQESPNLGTKWSQIREERHFELKFLIIALILQEFFSPNETLVNPHFSELRFMKPKSRAFKQLEFVKLRHFKDVHNFFKGIEKTLKMWVSSFPMVSCCVQHTKRGKFMAWGRSCVRLFKRLHGKRKRIKTVSKRFLTKNRGYAKLKDCKWAIPELQRYSRTWKFEKIAGSFKDFSRLHESCRPLTPRRCSFALKT